MKYVISVAAALVLLTPLTAAASCDLEYEACDKSCSVKYFNDDSGHAGCVSKCVAQKGVCLTKKGAASAAEAGGEAWEDAKEVGGKAWDATSEASKKAADSAKSFFKGLTEE
ncbi:MAG: hypothetical protein OIF57_00420 [Marinobacterium sp.]|nr:hypothetical protein [Marinobacterium sp.]